MIIISVSAVVIFTIFSVVSINLTSLVLNDVIEDRSEFEAAKCAEHMGMVFANAEGNIDALHASVITHFDVSACSKDTSYLRNYVSELSPTMETALQDVNESAGMFLTFNPALSKDGKGYEIWYALDEHGHPMYVDAMANGSRLDAIEDEGAPNLQYYFDAIKKPNEGIWTDPMYDPDLKKEVFTYSRSIYSDNQLIGVIGTDIYTADTQKMINRMDVANKGEIVLLNEKYDMLIESDADDFNTAGLWKKLAGQMSSGNTGTINTVIDDENCLISYSRLSNSWTLAIIDKASVLHRPVNITTTLIIIMSTIMAMLAIYLSYTTLSSYMTPVEKAKEMLQFVDRDDVISPEEARGVHSNEDIEALVQKHISRQQKQYMMMAHQSRLAQAGQMLSSIIHQWKQPLNKLSILLGNLRDEKQYGELTDESLERTIKRSEEIIEYMSATINDFRSYLTPETEKEFFYIEATIDSVLLLLEDRIKLANISPVVRINTVGPAYGYRNALYHVLLNVIGNAIDALETSDAETNKLEIRVLRESDPADGGERSFIRIEVFNNGGNISEEIRDRLFTPHETTKQDRGGSGLGLAISRSLVEDSMDGTITIDNCQDGVLCVVRIAAAEDPLSDI